MPASFNAACITFLAPSPQDAAQDMDVHRLLRLRRLFRNRSSLPVRGRARVLQVNHPGAFAHYKTIAVFIKGAAGCLGSSLRSLSAFMALNRLHPRR